VGNGVTITRRLKEALCLVEIRILDHLVIGADSVENFAERRPALAKRSHSATAILPRVANRHRSRRRRAGRKGFVPRTQVLAAATVSTLRGGGRPLSTASSPAMIVLGGDTRVDNGACWARAPVRDFPVEDHPIS